MPGISFYRKQNNLTQQELAGLLGVPRATLAMWETSRAWPPSSILPIIAELLNCTIEELYHNPAESI